MLLVFSPHHYNFVLCGFTRLSLLLSRILPKFFLSTNFLINLSRIACQLRRMQPSFCLKSWPANIFSQNPQKRRHFNPSLVQRIFIAWQCHQFLVKATLLNFYLFLLYLFLTFIKSRHSNDGLCLLDFQQTTVKFDGDWSFPFMPFNRLQANRAQCWSQHCTALQASWR